MRVLITGGAGFIGSHLADAYIARGDEVFALDDLSTGSFENVRHLWAHPRFHLVIGSVEDADRSPNRHGGNQPPRGNIVRA